MAKPKITKAQWIAHMALKNGVTPEFYVEAMKKQGEEVIECDCKHSCCWGFIQQPKHPDDAKKM